MNSNSVSCMVRLVCAVAAIGAACVAPARADDSHKFVASTTEEFSFFGCPAGIDPLAVDTCGTAKATPFGKAVVGTVIDVFFRLPSGCFADVHTTTFHFRNGATLVMTIEGELCPTGGRNFSFDGTYRIVGGTGHFAGAEGAGFVASSRNDGPIMSELHGTIAFANDDADEQEED